MYESESGFFGLEVDHISAFGHDLVSYFAFSSDLDLTYQIELSLRFSPPNRNM
jgi:hypothetical protein